MTSGPTASIEAVTFDVGGTLIEPWPSVGYVYAEVARDFGVQASAEEMTSAFVRSWKDRGSFGYTRGEWFGVVCESFGCAVSEEMFDAVYERFAQASGWRVFDDVIPALEFGRFRNLKLGVISNWDERLKPLLGRLNLLGHFDAVVVSVESGAHKPDSKIFLQAAKALNSDTKNILHVGDSEREDVRGATNAGMRARKIDRKAGKESLLDILRSLDLQRV